MRSTKIIEQRETSPESPVRESLPATSGIHSADSLVNIRVGTAGWSIPRAEADHFPASGSNLERYAARLPCAEINSTFYRSHRPSTYARWVASTPEDFRFAVKVPRSITHECELTPTRAQLQQFFAEVKQLAGKLGPLLFQLPPKQTFESSIARSFLSGVRDLYPTGEVAIEPRHLTWFSPEAADLLRELHFARVIADPSRAPAAQHPAADARLIYYRLHGSPRVYYSSYSPSYLETLSTTLAALHQSTPSVWCIFDNTASGAAAGNALALAQSLQMHTADQGRATYPS